MGDSARVLTNLRKTRKGQLKYDRDWYQTNNLGDVLQEFSSPPRIPYCPAAATCHRTSFIEDPEEKIEEPEAADLDDTTFLSIPDTTDAGFHSTDLSHIAKKSEEQTTRSSEMFRSQKAIIDYEHVYDKQVRNSVQDRSEKFRRHSEKLAVDAQNKVYQLYSRQEHDALNKLQQVEAQYRQKLDEINEQHKKLREHHKRHAQMLDAKMRHAEEQKRQLEKEEERLRQEELKEHLDTLSQLVIGIKDISSQIDDKVNGCKYSDQLGEAGAKCANFAKQILAKAEQVYKQSANGNCVNVQYEQILKELHNSTKTTAEYAKTVVGNATKKGEEADKVKADAAKAAAQTASSQASTPQSSGADAKVATTSGSVSNKILRGDTGLSYVTVDGLKLYTRLQDMLTEHQKLYASLVEDPQLKKYKFDLQKAVNIPVNAISPTSGSHLRDKLTKLGLLLSGQPVEVDGGKRISATQHPNGLAFCKDLFAKKIVSQGVEQVSSNHKSAFAFAAVAVGVWSELPDVGDLILAHFFKQCPYLAPFYKPLPKTLTEGDQSKMDSVKDKFLKRMSGLTRLYASFMVVSLPRGVQRPHPHGVEHAWIWLTSVMNLDPQPDITATIVYDFLQVVGHALWKAYGKQFLKLLQLFCTEYVQKIRSVSQQAGGGPIVRLENYIQKCISSGNIAAPEGLLPPGFW